LDLSQLPSILPLHFFQPVIELEKGNKPEHLDSFSEYLEEESFSELKMAISEHGIHLELKVLKPFEKALFPDVAKGDSFEFFIDIRANENSSILHKYCHHFVFLPKEVDGIIGCEMTRFKTNDKRDLCNKDDLKVKSSFSKNHYTLDIFIPDIALYGFDLSESSKFKFAYIVHRGGKELPNHFPKCGLDFNFKDHPSLWADLHLI
jgi:hypothetical protein